MYSVCPPPALGPAPQVSSQRAQLKDSPEGGWRAARSFRVFLFPSLPPSFLRSPPPSLGRGGSRRGRLAVARSREHFKASLARGLEEVYRLPLNSQASPTFRRPLGRGAGVGGGCAWRFGLLAIFKEKALNWPGIWPNPVHVLFPLFFPIVCKENIIL